ncbi:MAG: hypothetical protein JNK12_06275 [Acidimicrobiales bacterium]|nr:hypothetical protein [Acidimicrobiales bacterium]
MGESNEPVPDLGDAWRGWAERTAALFDRLDEAGYPTDPATRAIAVRHLTRQVALALQGELEHADPRHPTLHRYEQPWSQWGAPNPDNVYERCAIDPTATYVLRGRVDGVHEALFSLVEGDMHLGENGVHAEVALTDLIDLHADSGALELLIGPRGTPGVTLVSDPATRMLLIRQYLYDWTGDRVGSFSVERVDLAGVPAPPPEPADVVGALERAARWVEESITFWAAYAAASRDLLEHNTFTAPNTPPGGAPSIAYGGGCFELGPDEVLLIEHDEPDAHYWNWSIHHLHWFDSGAFHERPTSLNGAQAHVDADGVVRVVVSAADPGTPNWLDPEGQAMGMAVYRYVGARTKPHPQARVVRLSDLRSTLPADHPVVDDATRRRTLAARRLAAQARWG